jgi:hypothetical protein
MKRWILPAGILFFILMFQNSMGEEIPDSANIDPVSYSGFYIGGQATTNGLGFNLRYIINKRLTLKSGVESMHLSYSFLLDENEVSYDTEINYKTGGVFLLADFFYARSLYISGGVMMNDFQPFLKGIAASDLPYGDISIPSSKVGEFVFSVEPDLKYSPYIGLGLQKFIGKLKLISWNFETGFYYMGPPKVNIEATGLLAPTADPAHGQKGQLEKQFSVYKYYPVAKLAVSLRIF